MRCVGTSLSVTLAVLYSCRTSATTVQKSAQPTFSNPLRARLLTNSWQINCVLMRFLARMLRPCLCRGGKLRFTAPVRAIGSSGLISQPHAASASRRATAGYTFLNGNGNPSGHALARSIYRPNAEVFPLRSKSVNARLWIKRAEAV
jgi:hypothetical protein